MLALSVFSFCLMLGACGKQEAEPTVAETVAVVEVPQTSEVVQTQATEPTIPEDYIEYNGEWYAPRKGLETILLMGLDKYEMETETIGYTNKMQSDFLLLLVVDEAANTCDILHINRETMTDIPRLGIGGATTGSYLAQITLAHTYGSGGSDSAINSMKAVSNMLGGAKVDHYMTLTMDGIAIINDLVGGVPVYIEEDMTVYDPALVQGTEVTLKGDQAMWFVRARMLLEDSSNTSRMRRQEAYLNSFYAKLMECIREDEEFPMKVLMKTGDHFTSDYSASGLDRIFDVLANCEISPFYSLEGETVKGAKFMEFYPTEESIQETILQLFYEKAA